MKQPADSPDFASLVDRLGADPPHRMLTRLVTTSYRTGLWGDLCRGRLGHVVGTFLQDGLDIRSLHRLHAAIHPTRPAVVDPNGVLTYREIDRDIDRLAAALREHFEVGSDAPVALTMENRTEYVVAWFALFRLGVPGVHVSYRSTPEELAYHLEHSGARTVVGSARTREGVREVRQRLDRDVAFVDTDRESDGGEGVYAYDDLLATAPDAAGTSAEGGGGNNIVYTSGTTGQPKGTVRDMAKLGVHDLVRIVERLPVRTGDRHLVVAPLYHSGGQIFTLLNMALGATVYLLPEFEAEATLRTLSRRDIHSLFMVPTMIRRVLNLPEETHEAHPTPSLRVLISGAAPFSESLRRRAMQRFGTGAIHDFYGATELGWVTLIDGFEMRRRPGSVGRPIAGQEIRILDDEGRELPPGEVGEIYVRSPHTMEGYLDNPEADRESRRDEWWTVEDLGYLDEDGYLHLAGRARDMVITGGVNVYPVEIEDVLVEHSAVDEAGVVGIEDDEWGEKLVAFVVPHGESLDVEALERHAEGKLAGYKVPKEWRLLEDPLPRNPTGKILKGELKRRYEASE